MDPNLPAECGIHGAAVRKEGGAIRKEAKRPPPDIDATQPATLSKPSKKEKQAMGAPATVGGSMAKGPPCPPVRPMDMVLDIVGTARGDRGRNCDEHEICGEVLAEDVVVCLRREQILVPNKLGKGEKEETAYTVNWVTDGQDRCRVGFLPRAYVAQGGIYDGVLCQVVRIGNESDNDKNERAKVRHSCGYACVQVISPLNFG
jgi:hypothetical protein